MAKQNNVLVARIDIKKIDMAKVYKGKKGDYVDLILIMREEEDQYGNDGFVAQSVTKEEREQGVRGNIIGNVRYINTDKKIDEYNTDLPF